MVPPTITTPATIPIFFIIFLLKNFAFSGGVSVGGGEGECGDPSDVKWSDGINPSDIEWSKGTDSSNAGKLCEDSDPPDAGEYGVDIDSSGCQSVDDNDDGWCEGVNSSCGE
jgi:hypothetical protein